MSVWSKLWRVGTMSSTASALTASGASSASRCPTRAPRSCPTTANRSKPRVRITASWSAAMARLEYSSSESGSGLALSPYPRRSVSTTVWVSASLGATRCQITWVCG